MDIAMNNGAIAGKVSGAGGGGFIMFIVEPTKKMQVRKALNKLGGQASDFQFTDGGTRGWKIYS
jgi:D-glycero-alpha-D-manno-heptose-7-phosphate kinase